MNYSIRNLVNYDLKKTDHLNIKNKNFSYFFKKIFFTYNIKTTFYMQSG